MRPARLTGSTPRAWRRSRAATGTGGRAAVRQCPLSSSCHRIAWCCASHGGTVAEMIAAVHILITEDEPLLARFLARGCRQRATTRSIAGDGARGARADRDARLRPRRARPPAARSRRLRRARGRWPSASGRRACSCSRPARRSRRASRRSTAAPPTSSPSRSRSTSCWRACAPRRARGRCGRGRTRRACARSRLDERRARCSWPTAAASSCRRASTTCSPTSCARRARSSRASSCSTRSGATSSIRARTSSTSASGAYGASCAGVLEIDAVRGGGYRVLARRRRSPGG